MFALAEDQCLTLFQSNRVQSIDMTAKGNPRVQGVFFISESNVPPTVDDDDAEHAQWSKLRENNLLVNQQSITGRSGLCADACAFNLIQAVSMDLGVRPTARPQEVFERFVSAKVPVGGSTFDDTVRKLRALLKARFKGGSPQISAIKLKGYIPPNELFKDVDSITEDDIAPKKGVKKMLLSVQFSADGKLLFDHAQIAETFRDSTFLSIVEPNAPQIAVRATRGRDLIINGLAAPRFYYDTKLERVDSMVVTGVIQIDSRSKPLGP